jgi:hypothetical protein
MGTVIYIILFLFFFGMALIGAYMKGNEDGKKDMLTALFKKNIISSDLYVKCLKILDK